MTGQSYSVIVCLNVVFYLPRFLTLHLKYLLLLCHIWLELSDLKAMVRMEGREKYYLRLIFSGSQGKNSTKLFA